MPGLCLFPGVWHTAKQVCVCDALGEGNFPSCIPGRQAEVLISGETEAAVDMCVDVAWFIWEFRNNIIQQLLENKLLMKVTEI